MKRQIIVEMRVHPNVLPFMDKHGRCAVDTITKYLSGCKDDNERLGALGVLSQVLLAYGDALQADWLKNLTSTKQ